MNYFHRAPFMRLLLPFASGIGLGMYLSAGEGALLAVFLGTVLILYPARFSLKYRRAPLYAVLLNGALFMGGFQLVQFHKGYLEPDHFSKVAKGRCSVLARAEEDGLEKSKSWKLRMKIEAVGDSGRWKRVSGSAMFYFRKDSLASLIRYGDLILLQTAFRNVPGPQNPGEFDYRAYLADHAIYQQAFADSGTWKFTGQNKGNFFRRAALLLRERMLAVLSDNGLEGEEYAVASALILGYTDKLDADIISAYAGAGAVHVLSVSGLHVGIVYVVFNYLLLFLGKRKYGNLIRALLLIALLWFYAFLTGLSPSVLRSVAMFSFLAAARAFHHPADMFNTLAVSAFVLLAIDPFLLKDVGFQLSYLAVGGILLLQPLIASWWEPTTRAGAQLWSLSSVSIAAQGATFPLGLFYFHQFPNYFLAANLLVIPISALLTYAGMALLVFGQLPYVSRALAKLTWLLAWLLNAAVKWIDQLPGAVTAGLQLGTGELLAVYSALLFLTMYLFSLRRSWLYAFLCTVLLLAAFSVFKRQQRLHQCKLIVYNVPGGSAIDFIRGEKTIFLADSSLFNNKAKLNFHINNSRILNGISEEERLDFSGSNFAGAYFLRRGAALYFAGLKVIVTGSAPCGGTDADLVIVRGRGPADPLLWSRCFGKALIVLDSSVPRSRLEKWNKRCGGKGYYSVSESGALELDLYSW